MFKQDNESNVTRFLFAILLIIVSVAQFTWLSAAGFLGISPNLVLVFVLILAGRYGAREGVVWAFAAGILLDLLALDPLGSNALALIPVALIGSVARRSMLHSGLLMIMLMVIAGTVTHFVVASIIDTLMGSGYSLSVSIRLGLVTAFLNALTVPPLYGLVMLLDRVGVQRVAQA